MILRALSKQSKRNLHRSQRFVPRGIKPTECRFQPTANLAVIRHARALLQSGNILAIKGLGGFLLACDAANDNAVSELRRRKQRPAKPFALMVRDIASARTICHLSPTDETALLSPRRPITILPKRAGGALANAVAPGNNTLGVMLPCTPLHYLLFSDSPDSTTEFPALVMTSGDISEEPIVTSNAAALRVGFAISRVDEAEAKRTYQAPAILTSLPS